MLGSNPFSNIIMIENPEEFFGRKNELKTIYNRLSTLQSCDVFGKRKIGKSSLLHNIFVKSRDELGDSYRVAYINMQGAKYHTVGGFLKYSLSELGCDPECICPSDSLNKNLISFSESIEGLRRGTKPVLLIDEFENLTKRSAEFNNDFFDTMRSLGSNGNIAYVTASLRSLRSLCIEGNFTSPFYNIFSEVPLGMFSPEETSEFLSAEREGVEFNGEEIEFIKEIANDYPLNLQIACYHVLENRGKKWNEKKLRKDIGKEFKNFEDKRVRTGRSIIKQGKSLFNYLKELPKEIIRIGI